MLLYAQPSVGSFSIGLVLVVCGELIRFWGVAIAGSETRTTEKLAGTALVTSGPYAYVRNPLYIGNMLMYFGFAIIANVGIPYVPLFVAAFFLIQYIFIVQLEESYLLTKFGSEYETYCRTVPRFFPRWKKNNFGETKKLQFDFQKGIRSERRTLQASILLVTAFLLRWQLWR